MTLTPLRRAVLWRVIYAVVTLFVVSVVIFFLVSILPGSEASRSIGQYVDPARLAALNKQYGLDRPVVVQYLSWLGDALRGNLGQSLINQTSVDSIIGGRIWNTVDLASICIVCVAVLAFAVGLITGSRSGSKLDVALSSLTSAAVGMPDFIVATIVLFVFSEKLHWLPPVVIVSPNGGVFARPLELVLPFACVIIVSTCWSSRLVRAVVIDAEALPHVEAARLQGVPERTVLRRHLLPSVIGPSVQVIASVVPYLIGGTIVIEEIFNYPGLAQVLLNAVQNHDAPTVEGIGLIYALATVCAFLVADIAGLMSNPRLRSRME